MIKHVSMMSLVLAILCVGFWSGAFADDKGKENMKAYQELFEQSMKEKRGLMFYVNGQAIGGGIVKVNDAGFVEIRNQTYTHILIRVDQIDAVAASF